MQRKEKCSTTPIDISVKLCKGFFTQVAKPLCSLINTSLQKSECLTLIGRPCMVPQYWSQQVHSPTVSYIPLPSSSSSVSSLKVLFDWAYTDILSSIDPQHLGTNIKKHDLSGYHHELHQGFCPNQVQHNHQQIYQPWAMGKSYSLVWRFLVSVLRLFCECFKAVYFRGAILALQSITCSIP